MTAAGGVSDSEVGRGTQFTVSLYRGVAHLPSERIGAQRSSNSTATRASAFIAEALRWLPGAAAGASKPPPASTAVPGARILVADDNADMREYLTRLLAERWVVESVPDGEAALARTREGRFDLVLTDAIIFGARDDRPTHWTEPHRPDEGTLRILDILSREAADLIEHRQREDALRSSEATVRELRAAESASAEREIRGYQERIQQMAFDAVVTEERERRRIAADLHDGVGQSLALSQIKLTTARQEVVGAPRDAIDQVIALIGESIASARTLTFELSPPILYDLGLKEALCWLAEKLKETYATRIEIADDETDKPLDDVTAGLVFRATRELLMNVVKHSRAPTAKVSLRRAGDRLAVTVEDTGVGFDPDDPKVRSGGFGFLSVREQIRRLRGSTEVIASPGQGARVVISVPIAARDQGKGADAARPSQDQLC